MVFIARQVRVAAPVSRSVVAQPVSTLVTTYRSRGGDDRGTSESLHCGYDDRVARCRKDATVVIGPQAYCPVHGSEELASRLMKAMTWAGSWIPMA